MGKDMHRRFVPRNDFPVHPQIISLHGHTNDSSAGGTSPGPLKNVFFEKEGNGRIITGNHASPATGLFMQDLPESGQ
jgi:hypothetical protein